MVRGLTGEGGAGGGALRRPHDTAAGTQGLCLPLPPVSECLSSCCLRFLRFGCRCTLRAGSWSSTDLAAQIKRTHRLPLAGPRACRCAHLCARRREATAASKWTVLRLKTAQSRHPKRAGCSRMTRPGQRALLPRASRERYFLLACPWTRGGSLALEHSPHACRPDAVHSNSQAALSTHTA